MQNEKRNHTTAQPPHDTGPTRETALGARVAKGVGWVFAQKILSRGLNVVTMIVLANLLRPEDFGVFGIVMLAVMTLSAFTRTGFDDALIQHKENPSRFLNTAWTITGLRGLALAGVLFAVAPAVGWFFGEPGCVPLLRVMGISVAIEGLRNIGVIYFQKELQFYKHVMWQSAGTVVGVTVGIILAFRLRNAWALVYAGVASSATECLLSYVLHPYRPRPHLNREAARDLFDFGGWVLLSSILLFFATKGDDFFLGKVLGATALGIYQMAYRISNAAATEITHTISSVTFPGYARIQDDMPRFAHAYLKVLRLTMFWAAPVAAGIAGIAPSFVTVALGARWAPAIVPMQILSIFGLMRAYEATTGPVCYASGKPGHVSRAIGAQLVVMGILIWPLTQHMAIIGTCLAVMAGLIVANAVITAYTSRILSTSPLTLLKCAAKPILLCLPIPAVTFSLQQVTGGVFGLCLQIVLGATVYLALSLVWQRRAVHDMAQALDHATGTSLLRALVRWGYMKDMP